MTRTAAFDIDPLLLRRWSPRAMSGEALTETELSRLLEGARWAPSSGNGQPWRFVHARRGTDAFQPFFELLDAANQEWCLRAGALLLVCSARVRDDGRPIRTHAFDTGAAWMGLALQGTSMGLVVHGMAGFDLDRARVVAAVPETHDIHCMVAAGKPGRLEELSEKNRAREQPNDRKPQAAWAFAGRFPPTK